MLPPPSLYFTIEKRFLSVRASLSYIHKHYVIEFGKGVLLVYCLKNIRFSSNLVRLGSNFPLIIVRIIYLQSLKNKHSNVFHWQHCIALQISTVVLNYLKVSERTKLKNGRFINKSTACQGFRNPCFCLKRIQCSMSHQGIPY